MNPTCNAIWNFWNHTFQYFFILLKMDSRFSLRNAQKTKVVIVSQIQDRC